MEGVMTKSRRALVIRLNGLDRTANTSINTDGIPAGIRTKHIPNTYPKYHLSHPLVLFNGYSIRYEGHGLSDRNSVMRSPSDILHILARAENCDIYFELFMPLVILHHLLNVSVQLANKKGLKKIYFENYWEM
jgi:hypothetical protein